MSYTDKKLISTKKAHKLQINESVLITPSSAPHLGFGGQGRPARGGLLGRGGAAVFSPGVGLGGMAGVAGLGGRAGREGASLVLLVLVLGRGMGGCTPGG